ISHGANVHCGHRDVGVLAARARLVQRIDAGALDADFPAKFPDQPARRFLHVALAEYGSMHEPIDRLSTQRGGILDPHATVEIDDLASALNEILNGRERRHRVVSLSSRGVYPQLTELPEPGDYGLECLRGRLESQRRWRLLAKRLIRGPRIRNLHGR